MDGARDGEETAVDVRRAGVHPVLRPLARLGEVAEELAEVVGARPPLVLEQTLDDAGEHVGGQELEVLGEERPDDLEDELRELVAAARPPLAQALVEVGQERDGLASELGLPAREVRLPPGEEEERVEVLGQLREVERRAGLVVDGAGLPHLEAVERAEHDVPRGGHRRRPRVAPVGEGLLAVLLQPPRLAGPLHLEDADARPDHVHEAAAGGRVLEAGADLLAIGAVAGQELGKEGLGLRPLGAAVAAPARGELGKVAADLLAGQRRHGR